MAKLTRKQFLIGSAASLGAAGLGAFGLERARGGGTPAPLPGEIVGASSTVGHRLRSGAFPAPVRFVSTDVVIVGGGIAGLGAGYQLNKQGLTDFLVLDLEGAPGGNASSGQNGISAYPWGAHYVPLLTAEASAVHRLFEDFGIVTGRDASGLPVYDELALCSDPQERLWRYGRWHDGLVPNFGIKPEDERQYARFFAVMAGFRERRDSAGRRAFAIPLDLSSQDPDLLALDAITMDEWMVQSGFTSEGLLWYVNYCCRDDYGTRSAETSAWAGIHYFAARNGRAANAEPQSLVTWPEGNGYLAHRLAEPLKDRIRTRALAFRAAVEGDGVVVDYWDEAAQETVRVTAKAAVLATPHFVTARLRADASTAIEGLSYAPWAVANITLSQMPGGPGVGLSWDNVIYNSPLLGYVNATHQVPQMRPIATVLTYYWPLSHLPPADARREALARPLAEWQDIFVGELLRTHPELQGKVERVDICLWGHAMVRPVPGYIWGDARRRWLQQSPPIFTAHSDMSGNSLFEEAYTHGVRAAENVLTYRGVSFGSVL